MTASLAVVDVDCQTLFNNNNNNNNNNSPAKAAARFLATTILRVLLMSRQTSAVVAVPLTERIRLLVNNSNSMEQETRRHRQIANGNQLLERQSEFASSDVA